MKIFKPIYILIIIFSILLFDLIAFNFVPRSLTTFAPMYNKEVYDVYWKIGGHFNESGNIYVGNLLTKYIK